MKTSKEIVLELCKREGKKRQVNVAQMTEIVGHLADIMHECSITGAVDLVHTLYKLGTRRAKGRKKAAA